MVLWFLEHWRELIGSLLKTFGVLFLCMESYEVITDSNIKLSLLEFVALLLIPGLIYFLVDGYFIKGFLRLEVIIPNPGSDTEISVKFGDVFAESGWKAIGVSDFFDSIVDEDLVSSKSLHG
ncbi:MAG: macro domain-containing protein, partial [Salaquimonas sp.]